MTYRVYTGPRGSERVGPMEKDRRLYKEYASLDDALAWADHASRTDHVALLIEGDDGTSMDKRAIARVLSHFERRV